MYFSEDFQCGIRKFAREAGMEDCADFRQLVEQATEEAVRARAGVKVAGIKYAATDTPFDKFLEKQADQLEKFGIIRSGDCTDSKGNKGSWILFDHTGSKHLGCHGSRDSAVAQEQAIEAHKHGSEKVAESPIGSEGREALATKYLGKSPDNFSMSDCMADAGKHADNPGAFCQSLREKMVGEHKVTQKTGE